MLKSADCVESLSVLITKGEYGMKKYIYSVMALVLQLLLLEWGTLLGQVVVTGRSYERPLPTSHKLVSEPNHAMAEGAIIVYETSTPYHELGLSEHIILADDVMLVNPGETDITKISFFADSYSFLGNPQEIKLWIFTALNEPAIYTQDLETAENIFDYIIADLAEPVRVPQHFYIGFSFQGNQDTDYLGVSENVTTGQGATESTFYFGFLYSGQLKETWISPSPWAHKYLSVNVATDSVDVLLPYFGFDQTRGLIPLTVQFSNFSSSKFDDPITTWEWDFDGDDIIDSRDQNPEWIFEVPGIFDVSLKVSNSTASQTRTQTELIHAIGEHSAVDFNGLMLGLDNYCFGGTDSSLNVTDIFSFEAWINPRGWGNAMYPDGVLHSGYGRVFSFGEGGSFDVYLHDAGGFDYSQHSLCVAFGLKASPDWWRDGSYNIQNTQENSIVLNEWQHIAVTYDGMLSECKIYIDGILQSTQSYEDSLNGPILDHLDEILYVGNTDNGDRCFDGRIDEIRIWNTVRTAEEIQSDMNRMVAAGTPGLVTYWPFNEGTGFRCDDLSGNGNFIYAPFRNWTVGIPLDPPTSAQKQENIFPDEFVLFQNYPNPFNPLTTIGYELNQPGQVTLNIFDNLGRQIVELVKEQKSPGYHQVQWDGRDSNQQSVPSGIYIYQINIQTSTGVRKEHKKMLLVK